MRLNGWKTATCFIALWVAATIASPAQTFTLLHSFASTEGFSPTTELVQGINGNFYGTASLGGNLTCGIAGGCGTIFELTPAGVVTTLYTFCSQSGCPDGATPSALLLATNGNFYGTTLVGGDYGYGTVFQITPIGALTTLHSLTATALMP
jgi:uncharacterized repeat protein (TIGR03803 family)